MGNLNSAIKRIENKGKKSVDPKKNQMAEVAPAVAAVGKGLAVAGKAVVKGVASMAKAGAKAGAKGAKVAAKSGMKAASKTSKPVARKLTTRRNVKNPRYKKLEKDDKGNIVRGKEFDRKLYDQDGNKKTQGYMSTIDGPTDKRSTHSGEMRQKKKEEDGAEKKVSDTAKSLKKGTKKAVQKTGEYAKKSVSATTSNFGTSSFAKEGITFKDYLNKL